MPSSISNSNGNSNANNVKKSLSIHIDEEAPAPQEPHSTSSLRTSSLNSTGSSSTKSKGIRLSHLPANLRASVEDFDKRSEGVIGSSELVMVIDDLANTKRDNKMLRYLVFGLGVFALLLIGCIFGASIAAARLANDTNVDPVTGIAYAKGKDHAVLKTEDVVIYSDNMDILGMSNEELKVLKQITLDSGSVKFEVKGYGRSSDGSQINIIVEGGSLTLDSEGITNATGLAEMILDSAFPEVRIEGEEGEEGEGQRRWLSSTCTADGETGGGSSGASNEGRA